MQDNYNHDEDAQKANEPMTKEFYAHLYCIDKWSDDDEKHYANYLENWRVNER